MTSLGTRERERNGRSIATLLAKAWRDNPRPADCTPNELERLAPLLIKTSSGPITWNRVRGTHLASSLVADDLRLSYRVSRLNSVRREREVVRAVSFLRFHGVEPLLFKGILAARLYSEGALRPFGDVDLTVAPGDFDRATEALSRFKPEIGSVDLHRRGRFEATTGGLLRRTGDEFWELEDFDWADLIAHSRALQLDGGSVRVLAPEDHLRLLCLHFLKHGGFRALWLCDIAAAIEGRGPNFDWSRFISGDPWRTRWVIVAVRLAGDLLEADLRGTPAQRVSVPSWIPASILRLWGTPFRWPGGRLLVSTSLLESPASFVRELADRWPDPLESTIRWRGPLRGVPRFPFQLLVALGRVSLVSSQLRTSLPYYLRKATSRFGSSQRTIQ